MILYLILDYKSILYIYVLCVLEFEDADGPWIAHSLDNKIARPPPQIKPGMSNLKYKSSTNTTNSSSSTTNPSNQPIWCSLTTPSQIARKYASIAPIWCHISRPRQLKKKFASTLHQAQNLLTRQHSRENNLNGINYIFELVL